MLNFRKERAKIALKNANFEEDEYVVIKLDKYDSNSLVQYVKKRENINDYIAYYPENPYVIDEVYNLNLDIQRQLEENRAYHIEKSNKTNVINYQNKALNFTKNKHEGQFRNDGITPYITHPINVAKLVMHYKGKSKNINDLISAAYLHDTLEDTDTTFNELIENFNIEIAYLVKELTTNDNLKKSIGKEKYLSYKLTDMSSWALDIKLCDRLDNVKGINDCCESFRNKYFFETINILNYIIENRELTNTQKNIISDTIDVLKNIKVDTKKLVKEIN